jgi:hypothetical protein
MERYTKDDDAVLDYGFDWSEWLGTDTIVSSVWTVPTGISQEAESETTTTTTVWLSGGTIGNTYTITNRIVTTAGRTDERSLRVYVAER